MHNSGTQRKLAAKSMARSIAPRRRTLLIGLALTTLLTPSVLDQSRATAAESRGLEEVIVTARKREESILNVPVAVTAFRADDLVKYNTNDISALTSRVPGLILGEQSSNIGSQMGMRGITQAQSNSGSDQSTVLVIDGLALTQGVAYRSSLFDMEAIEVLKGPQSLFYGKNATAGVISVRSKNPGAKLEFVGRISYEFAGQEKTGEAIISGPVTDTLGLRLAMRYSDMEGYFKNEAIGNGTTSLSPNHRRVPKKRDLFIRGTAVWEPTDKFDAILKVNYTKNKTDTNPSTIEVASCPDGINPIPGFGTFIDPRDTCSIGDKTLYIVSANPNIPAHAGILNGGHPFQDAYQVFGSLQMNYDLTDSLTLSSITGYYLLDMKALFQPAQGRDLNFGGAQHIMRRETTTQEIRLTSEFDSPVNFMVGGYFEDGLTVNRPRNWFLAPRDEAKLDMSIRTWSGFGQVLWDVVPDVQIAAGGRWTNEKRHLDAFNITRGAPFDGTGPGRPNVPIRNLRSDHFSPEVSVTWTPKDNFTLFASYREGTKSGSFQTNGNPTGLDISFDDEKVKGFEGGIKTRLSDRSLAFNLSGYRYEYKDLQVGASITNAGVIQIITTNAASAIVYGIDFDLTYAPPQVAGLTTFVAGNWNHSRFKNFNNAPCYGGQTAAKGCNQVLNPATGLFTAQDLAGKPLLKAPDFQASFGFDYEWPVFNDRMVMSLGSTTLYSTKYETDIKSIGRGDTHQKSYVRTNASLSLSDPKNGWELALIGSNLADEITAGTCATSNIQGGLLSPLITGSPVNAVSPSGVEELLCYTDPPRQVWLRLTLKL